MMSMNLVDLFSLLASGAVLGLTAGISPGPVLTLVISETLRKDRKAGIKVALSPLITDIPIILISLLLLSGLKQSDTALGIIALTGSVFLVVLGIDCLKFKGMRPDVTGSGPGSLLKGVTANLMNPHPYLFWITVGGPLVVKGWQTGFLAVVVFFLSFYMSLVGSKVIVALLTERSKTIMNDRGYIRIMQILGIALFVFAALFLAEGIKTLAA